MHVRTLSDFLSTKVRTTMDKAPESYKVGMPEYEAANWECFVYMDKYVIEIEDSEFILVIGTEDHSHTDVQELERKLFNEVYEPVQAESAALIAVGQVMVLKNLTVADMITELKSPRGDMDLTLIGIMEQLGITGGSATRYVIVQDKLIALLELYFPH